MKCFVLLAVMSLALAAAAEKQPLSRYQSIIDRQMFGPVPPDFDPTKSPTEVTKSSSASRKELTQEQEKLQSAVVFSVINVTPEGETAVGFTDNSDPKAPKHYYLKVGEAKDGWTVKEANPVEASMTIVKDDVEVSLKIGDNSAKGSGSTARAGAGVGAASASRRPGLFGSIGSRRQRLRQQQEEQAKAAADAAAQKEADRQAQAAAEKAEREAEREQQRQQLMAIQEELRKAREQRQQDAAKDESANDPE